MHLPIAATMSPVEDGVNGVGHNFVEKRHCTLCFWTT